ncbi:hypothetical protein GCM10007877_00290 [Marinibactrum halimedae]|uniref:Uncharacterized protein n=1 Tax=Marinibactrum halimedae TaxID=1444977 RepID=A0AA37WJK7_9GAMM|nr:hypothetical protein GCM10007877_00290 [Marinibactrum halimedae]
MDSLQLFSSDKSNAKHSQAIAKAVLMVDSIAISRAVNQEVFAAEILRACYKEVTR